MDQNDILVGGFAILVFWFIFAVPLGGAQYLTSSNGSITQSDIEINPDLPAIQTFEFNKTDFKSSNNLKLIDANETIEVDGRTIDQYLALNNTTYNGNVTYDFPDEAEDAGIIVSDSGLFQTYPAEFIYSEGGNQQSDTFSSLKRFDLSNVDGNEIFIELNHNYNNPYLKAVIVTEGEETGTLQTVIAYGNELITTLVSVFQLFFQFPFPLNLLATVLIFAWFLSLARVVAEVLPFTG